MVAPMIVPPLGKHTQTVILLHGRGDNARDFCNGFVESNCSDGEPMPIHLPGVRWVLPSARQRYSTVFGMENQEWFDIYSLTDPEARSELQMAGLKESLQDLKEVIADEIKLLPSRKIILGGISQGCATSILYYLFGEEHLAGFMGISGWLPFKSQIEQLSGGRMTEQLEEVVRNIFDRTLLFESLGPSVGEPVLLCHGTDDEVVDIELGRAMRNSLMSLDVHPHWREDDNCGHWLKDPEGADEIVRFIEAQQ